MRFYDAHNHLQDDRLTPWREQLISQASDAGVAQMVVNGTSEKDWSMVLSLAKRHPTVLPSFGLHPWYVRERSSAWLLQLEECLDQVPSAIGEIGLDRWILERHKTKVERTSAQSCSGAPASLEEQAEVFIGQLRLAAERDLPVSIHCLQAWGLLNEILRSEPCPACGFLLHSYGGPVEMVKPLTDLGAYFSLPGYFAHAGKHRQRETLKQVPLDRLLIETDAPDQSLPPEWNQFSLNHQEGHRTLNHPANVVAVYAFASQFLCQPLDELAARIEQNFHRLFANIPDSPRIR